MSEKRNFNYKSAILVSIVAIIVICVVSVLFGVMPLDALPVNYIGAALGSLIGALITLVLLRGQTDIEEKKGKDVKILEKKTEVFQDYIKDVWKVWEDQRITIEEFQTLTSKYYQNLMIYIKEKRRLDKIGGELSEMGKYIGKDNYVDISNLRKSIISIINELSDELELGGRIDAEIMNKHDKIVFPLLFKNSILEEANKELPVGNILEKGQFEFVKEFRNEPSMEYLCFNFIKYKGCKIVINGFDVGNDIVFILFIDPNHHEFDQFRCEIGRKPYVHRIQIGNNNLLYPTGKEDTEASPPINFSDEKSMEVYRTEKRGFAKIFANRIKYHFNETRIGDDDILAFLEKYYKEADYG
jgi:hypothetical protein